MSRKYMRFVGLLFPRSDLKAAFHKLIGKSSAPLTFRQNLALIALKTVEALGLLHRLHDHYASSPDLPDSYTTEAINSATHNIYKLPEIVLSSARAKTLNVLVPEFSAPNASAGYLGVFQFSKFAADNKIAVRLVFFEPSLFSMQYLKSSFAKMPGIESLLERLEIIYLPENGNTLEVSPDDQIVATVWHSAYFAEAVRARLKKPYFLYLVQDYEPNFYPQGTNHVLARATYDMPHAAIYSTEPLKDYFVAHNLAPAHGYTWFNNASSAVAPVEEQLRGRMKSEERKLVFYARPNVERNMFSLGALVLSRALSQNVFAGKEWEFFGVGMGNASIELGHVVTLRQLPRMPMNEYYKKLGQFDLCLTLMASPHPSLIPFDLAGSGAVVVTNNFANKNQDYFSGISANIMTADLSPEALASTLTKAVKKVENVEERISGAKLSGYPVKWEDTWQPRHLEWLKNHL